MDQEIRYIVQDLDSFEFLCSVNGEMSQTPYLSSAGQFENREDAFDAAVDEIGEAFSIFSFAVVKSVSSTEEKTVSE